MKLVEIFLVFLLLGGDSGLEPASIEAFPQQRYGFDGRANLLCAPIEPFFLCRPSLIGAISLVVVPVTAVATKPFLKVFEKHCRLVKNLHHL